jgi:hypothetical protein
MLFSLNDGDEDVFATKYDDMIIKMITIRQKISLILSLKFGSLIAYII